MTGEELTNTLHSAIMELTLEAGKQGPMETMKIGTREFPIEGYVVVSGHQIPLLNIRMMTDERELSRKGETT